MRIAIFLFLIYTSGIGNAQSMDSIPKENYLTAEVFGNGYWYSIGWEIYAQKNVKKHTGDRFGISATPFMSDPYKYVGGFYEKYLVFGQSKVKPELGMGASCTYYYKGRKFYVGYGYDTSDEYKYEFLLTTRFGIRYTNTDKYSLRLGALPLIYLNELDEGFLEGLGLTFGLSIGFLIK